MRVTLVFPPALCLPNQLYFALPLLAGALRRAGHTPAIVDLNARAADMLLDEARATRIVDAFRDSDLGDHARGIASRLAPGEAAKNVLRDPRRFYVPELARDAFWTVVDVLAGFYQLDPVLTPYDDRFAELMLANQRADRWSTLRELWDEGLADAVLASRPELVGICVAYSEQSIESVRLARKLRARDPGVHIAVGGPLITRFPERWLDGDWLLEFADTVIVGDGDHALVELCDALEGQRSVESVRNRVWRDAAGHRRDPTRIDRCESLDDWPTPDFSAADMTAYLQPDPIHTLITSRGCYWGRCAMCSIVRQDPFQMVSKAKLRSDVLAIAGAGGRFLQFQDVSVPPKTARWLAEVVVEEGLDLHWAGWMKFESCFRDRGFCELLAAGGCRSLHMGYESNDQRLLDLMRKGYRHADLLLMLRNLREAGISTELLWFIGFPTQTRADVIDSARFLWQHREWFGLASFVGDFGLHPDCEVHRDPLTFGVTNVHPRDGRWHYDVSAGLSMNEAAQLKAVFAGDNNRTLTGNGIHLLHLVRNGLDLSRLARPMNIPAALLAESSPPPSS